MTMAGNLNTATAYGMMKAQRRLAKKITSGSLGKADKEAALLMIYSIRRDLNQPELPPYNSTECSLALQALAQNEGDDL